MPIKCCKCGRKPKRLKEVPFSETFFVATYQDFSKSLCPECSEKLDAYLKKFEIRFKAKQQQRKLEWLGIESAGRNNDES